MRWWSITILWNVRFTKICGELRGLARIPEDSRGFARICSNFSRKTAKFWQVLETVQCKTVKILYMLNYDVKRIRPYKYFLTILPKTSQQIANHYVTTQKRRNAKRRNVSRRNAKNVATQNVATHHVATHHVTTRHVATQHVATHHVAKHHVATPSRRNTSRRNASRRNDSRRNTKRRNAITSQRDNVATRSRRNEITSQRRHVATRASTS